MDPFALLAKGAHFKQKPSNATIKQPAPRAGTPGQTQNVQQPSKKRKRHGTDSNSVGTAADQNDAAGIRLYTGAAQQQGVQQIQQQQQQQQQLQMGSLPVPAVHSNDPYEAANLARKALRIKVKGNDIPNIIHSWSGIAKQPKEQQQQQQQEPSSKKRKNTKAAAAASPAYDTPVACSRKLLQHVLTNGWSTPTPIQAQAVPALLTGREVLAVAPTGSGKTLAFLLPMSAILMDKKRQGNHEWLGAPKALLLSPTQELAAQTARVLKLLVPGSGLRCCLLKHQGHQAGNDFSKVDVLIATPLRLKKLIAEDKVDLSKVMYFVLDEADKLLSLGFTEQVDAILAAASNPTIQRAFFSATLPEKVEQLAYSVLRDPLQIIVGARNSAQQLVKQRLLFVGREEGKVLALRQLLQGGGTKPPVLLFVSTKARAEQLYKDLITEGLHIDYISSNQPSSMRAAAVENFRSGKTWVLIATDLIGRGMDFAGVNTVINYDFPYSTADYIHRIGRTGRAGYAGEAVTFFTENDAPKLRSIAHLAAEAGSEVPEWMLHMTKQQKRKHKDATAPGQQPCKQAEVHKQKKHNKGKTVQATTAAATKVQKLGGSPTKGLKPAAKKLGRGAAKQQNGMRKKVV